MVIFVDIIFLFDGNLGKNGTVSGKIIVRPDIFTGNKHNKLLLDVEKCPNNSGDFLPRIEAL